MRHCIAESYGPLVVGGNPVGGGGSRDVSATSRRGASAMAEDLARRSRGGSPRRDFRTRGRSGCASRRWPPTRYRHARLVSVSRYAEPPHPPARRRGRPPPRSLDHRSSVRLRLVPTLPPGARARASTRGHVAHVRPKSVTASCSMRSRTSASILPGVTMSTWRLKTPSSSASSRARSRSERAASNRGSTSTSRSDDGPIAPRAAEPKSRTLFR